MNGMESSAYNNRHLKIHEIAAIENQEYEFLDSKSRLASFIGSLITVLIIGIGLAVLLYFVMDKMPFPVPYILIGVYSTLALWMLIYPFLAYKKRGYIIRSYDITYKTGVIWKKVISIPYNRIQHSSIKQGPIYKTLGLSNLNIFTAGGSNSDLEIAGLKLEDANKLKAYITKKVGELDV